MLGAPCAIAPVLNLGIIGRASRRPAMAGRADGYSDGDLKFFMAQRTAAVNSLEKI